MQMATYGWLSEARRGRSTQRASLPSPWRWTPTSWRPKTPANLEVRPGRWGFVSKAASSAVCTHLFILPLCPHSSFASAKPRFHTQSETVGLPLTASLSSMMFVHQVSFPCDVCLHSMSLCCMLAARGFYDAGHLARHSQKSPWLNLFFCMFTSAVENWQWMCKCVFFLIVYVVRLHCMRLFWLIPVALHWAQLL